MKAIVSTQNLNAALKLASPAVSPKSTLPVLGMIQLQPDESAEHLLVSATNLEIGIQVICAVDHFEDALAGVCIPARLLADLVGSFGNGSTELLIDDKLSHLAIKTNSSHADLKGLPSNEFPPMPRPDKTGLHFSGREFASFVNRVTFAASTDEARPVLQGVQMRYPVDVSGYVTLAATDGFRLVTNEQMTGGEVVEKTNFQTAIIPAHSLDIAAKMAGDGNVWVNFPKDRGQVNFVGDGWALTSQLIDGNFPDFKMLIPRSFKTHVTIPAADFLGAVKRAEIIARMGNGVVKLDIANNTLTVSATTEETGANETTIPVEVQGVDAQVISFNVRFLREAIENADGKHLTLEINDGRSPAKITGEDDTAWACIIMPMQAA